MKTKQKQMTDRDVTTLRLAYQHLASLSKLDNFSPVRSNTYALLSRELERMYTEAR